ncbi:hypothetical protein FB451DRAFT_1168044 [Mycena latifolia]|nr:hypothetical protein FB451DRAFT_1168044 [Mycena latifolia]
MATASLVLFESEADALECQQVQVRSTYFANNMRISHAAYDAVEAEILLTMVYPESFLLRSLVEADCTGIENQTKERSMKQDASGMELQRQQECSKAIINHAQRTSNYEPLNLTPRSVNGI